MDFRYDERMTSSDSPAAHLAGGRFADRYDVQSLLGEGGMGAVYRAVDLALGEPVALKILTPRSGVSPTSALRFRQEVRLARRVTHPNVVRVFDIGEQDGVLYFTMELVEGETLSALLRREGRLAPAAAARVGAAIADGLAAAHAAGILHRDLKPSNIVTATDGRVVLTDFGIAQSFIEDSDLTLEGMIVGTSRYMAPEQILRGRLGAHTDVFALGLLIHLMLAGELPERVPTGCAVDLRAAGVDAPPSLGALLERCLLLDPAARPSAEEAARALRELLLEHGGTMAPAPSAPAAPSSSAAPTTIEPPAARAAEARTVITAGAATQTLSGPIAVLPFQYFGPPETAYLGGTIAAELVDTLTQVRGLKMLGTGATSPFVASRDPVAIGAALGATLVLDGTVQAAPGGRVRMTVRLLDTGGVQRWSARHDGVVADLFSFQASIARVLAERLRVELTVISHEVSASPEALEHYLRARWEFRALDSELVLSAAHGFERCLQLSPGFFPAASGLAMASVRAWFYDRGVSGETNREAHAKANVARALEVAPHLAETHLAAGMLAVQTAHFEDASCALGRALTIAPTCVEALEYLGMLLCEAGKVEAGFERLSLAHELDPTRPYPLIYLGRAHALAGDVEQARAMYSRAEEVQKLAVFAVSLLRVRLAAWYRDPSSVQLSGMALAELESPRWRLVRLCLRALRAEIGEEEIDAVGHTLARASQSPRARSAVGQILCEVWLLLGRPERAFAELTCTPEAGLIDIMWLDRCPLLTPLRGDPRFADLRLATLKRADSVVG